MPLDGSPGCWIGGGRPDLPERQPRRPGPGRRAGDQRRAGQRRHLRILRRARRRIARAGAGAVQLVDRRRQRQRPPHLRPRERLHAERPRGVKQDVGAVEGVEIDQVEVDLPAELKVDVPADVPPAEERVEDVELVLLELLDAVRPGRRAQHVAAEVGVEANGGVDVEDVAAAVVAVPGVGADVEHVQVEILGEPPPRQQLVAPVGREAAHLIALADGANVDGEVIGAGRRRGAADQPGPDAARGRRSPVSHGLVATP